MFESSFGHATRRKYSYSFLRKMAKTVSFAEAIEMQTLSEKMQLLKIYSVSKYNYMHD